MPRRGEGVQIIALSYAVKLLDDVDDEVRAGAAAVIVDRHLLTGRVSEVVDAQIAELRDEVRKLGHGLERGLGIAKRPPFSCFSGQKLFLNQCFSKV